MHSLHHIHKAEGSVHVCMHVEAIVQGADIATFLSSTVQYSTGGKHYGKAVAVTHYMIYPK